MADSTCNTVIPNGKSAVHSFILFPKNMYLFITFIVIYQT